MQDACHAISVNFGLHVLLEGSLCAKFCCNMMQWASSFISPRWRIDLAFDMLIMPVS